MQKLPHHKGISFSRYDLRAREKLILSSSLSCVPLELFPLDIALLGLFIFQIQYLYCTPTEVFNWKDTESLMEAAPLTAPRPGRMRVGAVDGFGDWSVGLEAALTSKEATAKESAASGQALRRRRSQQIYWVETATACCCCFGGDSAPPTNEQTSND